MITYFRLVRVREVSHLELEFYRLLHYCYCFSASSEKSYNYENKREPY